MHRALDTLLEGLRVENGVIRTRGKYYAERRFVPYYHAKCDGGHYNYYERDQEENLWHVCRVTPAEREAFPELVNVVSVAIRVEKNKVCSWTRSCSYHRQ